MTRTDRRPREQPDPGEPATAPPPGRTGPAEPGPWALRDYALLADGERGALVGPRGDVVWMCAPRWDGDAVLSPLIGGRGTYLVTPEDPWNVWGGSYEDGTLVHTGRWVLPDGVVECREALALPADPGRAVLLRRVLAVRGTARVRVRLDLRAGFGAHPLTGLRRDAGVWTARTGGLRVRLAGAAEAVPDRDGVLEAVLTVAAGDAHDLVLEVGDRLPERPPGPAALWSSTAAAWRDAVPPYEDRPAARDARLAHAVLHGMTSASGGMVAAATTSLPERSEAGRNYDYRFAWVRDQCYAGLAVAAHGPHPLLDRSVRFTAERVLADGPRLRPAYAVDGGPVPPERPLGLPGYPGGSDRVGNRAGSQFQLDTYGEFLQLCAAAAARLDRLDADAHRAVGTAVRAVAEEWDRPDAGLWETHDAWWTHSRLAAVAGLHRIAEALPGPGAADRAHLADRILRETERRCLRPDGRWRRAADDDRVDAALLVPYARGGLPPEPGREERTRRAVVGALAQEGYVYRFRHGDGPLGEAEGAFLLCGFVMALADPDPVAAVRWFERNRAACGPPGLLAEEYDVGQRQLRGNLPQAFVHALLLECTARLGAPPASGTGSGVSGAGGGRAAPGGRKEP
ncbi:glycoside hydrolase family 15 protein [Streptacidiphilus sp. ASG 303]|uniref:glycoside hydrolase family 15 protein n=1 Tax=Streptacidiphilus sp. ASG 303 TaxID=2896847 RepID=UPI0035B0A7FC